MKNSLIVSTLMVLTVLIKFAQCSAYYFSLPPNLPTDKQGLLYGIPMTGQSVACAKCPPVKYIFPVDRFIEDRTKLGAHGIMPIGMMSPKNFKMQFVPLTDFLAQNSLPKYVKLWLIDPHKKCA